jgi:hypothetical protein
VIVQQNTIVGGFADVEGQSDGLYGQNINGAMLKVGIAMGPREWLLSFPDEESIDHHSQAYGLERRPGQTLALGPLFETTDSLAALLSLWRAIGSRILSSLTISCLATRRSLVSVEKTAQSTNISLHHLCKVSQLELGCLTDFERKLRPFKCDGSIKAAVRLCSHSKCRPVRYLPSNLCKAYK